MSSVVVTDDKDTADDDGTKDEASEDVSPVKKKAKTRDKRLFGNLMAHLGRARRDLKRNEARVENRRKVEDEVLRKQDENRQKLRQLHVQINREKKDELRQRKKAVIKQKDALRIKLLAFSWRAHDELLGNFLQTTTQPAIFFVPARHTDKTRAMLAARKETVAAEVKAKAEKMGQADKKAKNDDDEGGDGNDDGDDDGDDEKDSEDDSDDED